MIMKRKEVGLVLSKMQGVPLSATELTVLRLLPVTVTREPTPPEVGEKVAMVCADSGATIAIAATRRPLEILFIRDRGDYAYKHTPLFVHLQVCGSCFHYRPLYPFFAP
jgi:hypothetical protein